ncbi:MAG: TonB-dependent receptor [Bacteroidales bacterium]|nr:TonB-dependent receptor [Bacteroidales bacterium]
MKKLFLLISLLCVAALSHAQQHVIYGHIYDAQTGESLISANIYNPETQKGTTSNEYGYYSLKLSDGEQTVCFSYVGYETFSIRLSLAADTMVVARLTPSVEIEEVVVTDNRPEVGVKSTRMGASTVPLDIVRNMPVLLSEPDLLKTIQALPGVQAGMTGTCGIHVRGGDPDQNLFLLDGMPLYNVNHVFGFMSVFQAEAIKHVDFYKSGFPARFGGRLSSIVDVRTKDGDMKKYYGSFSIGLLTSHLNFEGPIIKDRTSFAVSARRSYLDWLIKPFMEDDTKVGFGIYDLTAKLNHKFSDKCRFYFSIYNGRDFMKISFKDEYEYNYDESDMKQKWGNTLATMRLNTVLAPRLFLNTTIAYTGYLSSISNHSYDKYTSFNSIVESTVDSDYHSKIRDYSALADFDFHIAPKHQAKFGASICQHVFRPDVQTLKYKENYYDQKIDTTQKISPNKITSQEINLYVEDDFPICSALQANVGVHLSTYIVEEKTYFSAQPRISLSCVPHQDWRIKAGFSMMEQYVHMLSSSSLVMPTDLWVPVTKRIEPMKAFHYSVGAYYMGFKGWELTSELYYKKSKNLLEYRDGMSAMGSVTNWQDKVEMGTGNSYGLELMAEKKIGKLTGWANYTISKTDRQFADGTINNGDKFPYKYDRRHCVNITLSYKLSEKIDFNAEWNLMSGARSTVAVGNDVVSSHIGIWGGENSYIDPVHYQGYIETIPRYDGRNNYKMPASHALNVGFNFHKQKKHGEAIWNLSVMNVYNHKNPDWVYLSEEWDDSFRRDRYYINKITILPILPSFSYTFKF